MPLSPDRLNRVTELVVHDNCPDGIASAILLRDAFRPRDLPVTFLQYSTPEHSDQEAKPGLLFCDFSPVAKRVHEFVAHESIVLDHHKTARAVVEAFGSDGVFGDEVTQPGVSGAWLAYEQVWCPLKAGHSEANDRFAQRLAMLAGVRDTWQTQSMHWRDACVQTRALTFFPKETLLGMTLDELSQQWLTMLWVGEILQTKHEHDVKKAGQEGWTWTSPKGTRVVVLLAGFKVVSDASEELGSKADLVVSFQYIPSDPYPKLVLSTRSATWFDCSAFCRKFGGGGHTKAAGCSRIVNEADLNPFTIIQKMVRDYENEIG